MRSSASDSTMVACVCRVDGADVVAATVAETLSRAHARGWHVTGLFARRTLKCCTARDLQDMKIPLGPRLKLLSNLEGLAA